MSFSEVHSDTVSALLWFVRRALGGNFKLVAVGENRDKGVSDIYVNGTRCYRVWTTEEGTRTIVNP